MRHQRTWKDQSAMHFCEFSYWFWFGTFKREFCLTKFLLIFDLDGIFQKKNGTMWLDFVNLVPLLGILQTDQGRHIGGLF